MKTWSWIAILVAGLTGCSEKKGDGGKADTPKPTVAIELTGAVTATLAGQAGKCGPGLGGTPGSLGFAIRSTDLQVTPDFRLDIDGATDRPGGDAVVYLRLAKAKFLRSSDPTDKPRLGPEGSIEVNSMLKEEGGDRTIQITGWVTCPPKP